MHHNILEFWRKLETAEPGSPERLSPRVCRLLNNVFEQWQNKPPWPDWDSMGSIFEGADDQERQRLEGLSVAERKGLAVARLLETVTEPGFARRSGSMRIDPDELIVGTLPPYSVGQGKELVRYLTERESLEGELRFLNEWSPFGHIVPNHHKVLQRGLDDIIAECEAKRDEEDAKDEDSRRRRDFYQSVIHSLKGVLHFASRYADECRELAQRFPEGSEQREGLESAAQHLSHTPAKPPRTFAEALQCLYLMHCALHFSGEIVPLGRLDQILRPFYEADSKAERLTRQAAQELIDCLWIKLDEKVVLNWRHLEDRFTDSDGALLGAGGASNFDQGGLANQWMQQVTIGGVVADNEPQAKDAVNDLTYFCLEAARRLPVNSPTLDLRVHSGSGEKLLRAAARTMLSGGAHPVLLNDDHLIPALHQGTGGTVELKSARNYACDGCYETLFAGETEFSFGFVAAMDVLEKALNGGANLGTAGGMYLRGMKGSWRTPPAAEIRDFEHFWTILRKHILLGCHRFLAGVLRDYGYKEPYSPSPLLSALIDGCIETGRDLSGGGARYHLFSPLMTGISTAADSLYVIRKLVFDEKTFTLEELVACLRSNWGANEEVVGLKLEKARIVEIQRLCRSQPKFGHGRREVDELAWRLIETFNECVQEARRDPVHQDGLKRLEERYPQPERPFEILMAPGCGTFEQYVFGGGLAGASPDGRPALAPIASDLSPAPLHPDQDPLPEEGETPPRTRLLDALGSWDHDSVLLLSDGAPADFNIPEDFPEDDLVKALRRFADGKGGNVMTVTVSNAETMRQAVDNPEDYNLLRVRMGGWTEFFITLFPSHQSQHRRRPIYGV